MLQNNKQFFNKVSKLCTCTIQFSYTDVQAEDSAQYSPSLH